MAKNLLVLTTEQIQQTAEVFNTMKDAGAIRIVVTFGGSGDEGTIHDITGYNTAGNVSQPQKFEKAIDDLAEGIIGENFGGYQDNDGGEGTVVFDASTRTVTAECVDYVMESVSRGEQAAIIP